MDRNWSNSSPPYTSTEERTSPTGSMSRAVGDGVGNGAVIRLTEAEATETGVVGEFSGPDRRDRWIQWSRQAW